MQEFILVVNKFIPPDYCKKIIDYFGQDLSVASTVGGEDRNIRNCETKDILNPTTFGQQLMTKFVQSKIFQIAEIYKNKIHDRMDIEKISQCDILRYEANSYKVGYDYHVDMGHTCESRQVSISVCLNNDFTGGEFEFNLSGNIVQYPQNVGDVIAFPSNFLYPHKVNKILTGTRYALVSWVI